MPTAATSPTGAPSSVPGLLLVVEASGSHGSVACLEGGRLIGSATFALGRGQADGLTPAVRDLLASLETPERRLGAVLVGAGPGSFTSLRIAAATAKGLASGRDVPLHAVPSPWLAVADPAGGTPPADGTYLVLQDALRGERFATRVSVRHGRVTGGERTARLGLAALSGEAEAGVVVDLVTDPTRCDARSARWLASVGAPVPRGAWEPDYGRLAEAQVQWETTAGRPLPVVPGAAGDGTPPA